MYYQYYLYVVLDEDKKIIQCVSIGSKESLEYDIEKIKEVSDKRWIIVNIFDLPKLKEEYEVKTIETDFTIRLKVQAKEEEL